MKIKLLSQIVVGIVTANLFLNAISAEAQKYRTFYCKLIGDKPNTVARINSSGSFKVVPVIRWSRPEYTDSGETPVQRCIRVSDILQNQRSGQGLDKVSFATTKDGEKVICVTSSNSYSCNLTIFTLEVNEDPEELINDLRQIIAKPELLDPENNNAVQKRWNIQDYGGNTRTQSINR